MAGRTTGLIELGEQVTWRARHFGLVHEHISRITAFDRPRHFRDSMVAGRFRKCEHDHFFTAEGGGTVMRDVLECEAPFWVAGAIVSALFLRAYLVRLLRDRNAMIKLAAEAS